jgi:dihydrofolate synthase/folylpolyglutamate synthase
LAVALAGLRVLGVGEEAVARGLAKADWPGRMQVIRRKPLTLVDGAHNPAGARALARSLKAFGKRRVLFAGGVLKDKDWKGIFRALLPVVDRFYLAKPQDERGLEPEVLKAWLKKKASVHPSPLAALKAASREAGPRDLVVGAGSLYAVGEILGWT